MVEAQSPRVAVYIDFDNIVMSNYDRTFRPEGREAWRRDNARAHVMGSASVVGGKLKQAEVDLGAILDYGSSFGPVVLSRAYADWSVPANASYYAQLTDRAIDLTQLFQSASGKNGADIRLSVDVVEDLFRLPDVTHVVIVAGDSDYVALAQRARRLGRTVVGVGVGGSTGAALIKACDVFTLYEDLPGLLDDEIDEDDDEDEVAAAPAARGSRGSAASAATATATTTGTGIARGDVSSSDDAADADDSAAATPRMSKAAASKLLVRAMQLVAEKDDEEWLHPSEVKTQMLRLNSAFREKSLGYDSFGDFLTSRQGLVEIKPKTQPNERRLKLRPHTRGQ
ncbi:NYN domain-containing protein [Schumannella sp. 10F1B-5-1]|uniref:NYN domain-containing protein n=1 Tax=Schumannella sp. 10F1B-5-1 TaxID=2590780 RepID=UPI001130AA35|nr:NYN domain-containing protein [Schumannella sp. 10F1B-5-1]TPW70052.1 NYN domain-containing protein [Schumannella sp. 10F1B-5-1]